MCVCGVCLASSMRYMCSTQCDSIRDSQSLGRPAQHKATHVCELSVKSSAGLDYQMPKGHENEIEWRRKLSVALAKLKYVM